MQSRKAPIREVQRAHILLRYSEGMPITEIEKMTHVSRPTIYKWMEKSLAMGIEEGRKDKYHRPKQPVITEEAKAWVISLACQKPKDFGYAAEVWTRKALAEHARRYGPGSGHDCLKKRVKPPFREFSVSIRYALIRWPIIWSGVIQSLTIKWKRCCVYTRR